MGSETHDDNVERTPGDGSVDESAITTNEVSRPENNNTKPTQQRPNGDDVPTHSSSQSKVTEDEMPPYISSSSVHSNNGVALVTSGDVEKPEVKEETEAQGSDDAGAVEIDSAEHRVPSKTSLAGEADSVTHRDTSDVSREIIANSETNENNALVETEMSPGKSNSNDNLRLSDQNGASEGSLSREKDAASHTSANEVQSSNRDTSQVSLSSNKDKSSGQDHDQRKDSMTVSEFFNAPSEASLSDNTNTVSHNNTSAVQDSTKDASQVSLSSNKETSSGQDHDQRKDSMTVSEYFNAPSEASLSDNTNTVSHTNTSAVQDSNKDASQVSLSSNKETSSGQDHDQRKGSMTVSEFFTAPSEASLSDNTNTVSHSNNNAVQDSNRDTSQVSLSSTKGMASGQDESQRKASMTVSEFFGAPSDTEFHLSNQSLGSSQQNALPATTETEHPDEPNKIVKEETVSEKDTAADKTIEIAESADPFSTRRDSSMSTDTDPDRICTVTANVKIGCIEHLSGHKTVTLTGSVYRLPREDDSTTPKPGDKIGIVKGDVTSSPADNETSEKLAILRGDLFAVSGEAAENGLIATASIDVLSCSLREKLATITADVAPSDDPEHQSGVISGEVLAASERGSYDDKIGSLSGKVVALTFGEGVTSLANANS